MSQDDSWRGKIDRRRLLKTTGVSSLPLLAGCLGDDDDDDEPTDDDATDIDDSDGIDDGDDVDDFDDENDADDDDVVEDIERYDVTAHITKGPPMPADVQYWSGSGHPIPSDLGGGGFTYYTMEHSIADNRLYGQVVDSWDYQPGVIELDLRDDIYWWDGAVMNAEDYTLAHEFTNYNGGGDDLDAHDRIVRSELVDEFTWRLALVDTWREEFAIASNRPPYRHNITQNRNFIRSWVERFRDAPGLDAIEEIREEVDEYRVETDDELVEMFHHPFEFRLEGDIGNVGEDYWRLDLVPEKNGNVRAWTDEINYEHVQFDIREDPGPLEEEQFIAGRETYSGPGTFDADVEFDFPVQEITYPGKFADWAFQFQFNVHPTDNVGFRRAWCYFCDRSLWVNAAGPDTDHPTIVSPFLTDERTQTRVSDDLLDAFTDYGWNEMKRDEARAEMEAGGFERDADGNWLMQEDGAGGDAGEPISLSVHSRGWMDYIADDGSDFFIDMEDFGIELDHVAGHISSGGAEPGMAVIGFRHGGGLPEIAFDSVWGGESLSWANPPLETPATVEAPPVGEPAGPGDRSGWVEYETRSLNDRLGTTQDPDTYQQIVDELSWAWNQLVPRFMVEVAQSVVWFNNDYWEVDPIEENPHKWIKTMDDHHEFNGELRYVGPETNS